MRKRKQANSWMSEWEPVYHWAMWTGKLGRFLCLCSVTWFHVPVRPHGIVPLSRFCPVRLAPLGQIPWPGIEHNASKKVGLAALLPSSL